MLIRYWFSSEQGRGIGVTAKNLDDAIALIKGDDYVMGLKPKLDSYTQDIDVQTLDQDHVIPNMGLCSNRGIWFPNVS